VPAATNGYDDIYVHDRAAGTTVMLTHDEAGTEGNASSVKPSFSQDGWCVAFYSYASNLVAGDANGRSDVFVCDLESSTITRMSVDTNNSDSNGDTSFPTVSADGRVVAFSGTASDLVAGDGNKASDVFIRDRCTVLASWTNYGAGLPGFLGVPTLTAQSNPVIGQTLTVDLSNSRGVATGAFLFLGFQRASIPFKGGTFLVQPAFPGFPLSVPAVGLSLSSDLPHDWALGGLVLDVQVVETDPGAVRGVSLTPGLELVLGS
jgi:hypothetical protein